jgi:hypothetical protein
MPDNQQMARGWFQFRLRSLLIVVTAASLAFGWVAGEAHVVQERKAMQKSIDEGGGACVANDVRSSSAGNSRVEEPPMLRRLLGDTKVATIFLPRKTSEQDMQRIKTLFPSAGLVPLGIDSGTLAR